MVNAGATAMGVFGALGVSFSIDAIATDQPSSGGCSGNNSFCLPSSGSMNFEPLILGGAAVLAFGHALGLGIPLIAAGAQEKPVGPALELGPGTLAGAW